MAITRPDDSVAYQTDTFTALEPVNWPQKLIEIFRDDETYGFENRLNPQKNIFKNFNVVLSVPDNINDVPALWMTIERVEPSLKTYPNSFMKNFTAWVDIYIICMRNTFVEYNDLTWTIPSTMTHEPDNNLFILLMDYVATKLKDNCPIIEGTGYKIMPRGFTDLEFHYTGFHGNTEARAVRIGQIVEVQLT